MAPNFREIWRTQIRTAGMAMVGLTLIGCASDPAAPPLTMISMKECNDKVAAMRGAYDERTARDRAESAEQRRKDAQELESVRAAYKDATGRLVELTRLELKRAVLFGFGEDDLDSTNRSGLQDIVEILAQHPTYRIRVEGHTDDRPIGPRLKDKFDTNWELSAARPPPRRANIIYLMRVGPPRGEGVG
jgi:chemotaxis protein MotB